MGNLKNQALNNTNEDVQEHTLNDDEAIHLRMLNAVLPFHIHGQKIISGFLYYVCTNRLGYPKGSNLSFKFDFDDMNNNLTVSVLPEDISEVPQQ